jgi:spermidine synthase
LLAASSEATGAALDFAARARQLAIHACPRWVRRSPLSPRMTTHAQDRPAASIAARQFLPVLLLLFVGSGCAALIYEIVWFQLLQFVIGSTAVSLGVLLGTFMGGMCIGSLLLPRFVSRRHHPLRVYAVLEGSLGIIALVALFGTPTVARLYATVGHGMPGIFMRAMLSAALLLPPTVLMGATLPAIARWMETTREGVSWMGFFYGGNIAGAVFGSLLAGFYLLRVYEMATATFVAVGMNVVIATVAYVLSTRTPQPSHADDAPAEGAVFVAESRSVYVVIALSGLVALGAEVVWTRLLSLLFGASVYTFSIILAVFLTGLGIGSAAGSVLARRVTSPKAALGWCQMWQVAAIAWTSLTISRSLPYWPINPSLTTNPWFNFQLDLVRCIWTILPPTLLWGASFPLAVAAVARRGQDPARLIGGVYAANTVGAIIGSLSFGMLVIPYGGTRLAQRVMIAVSLASALMLLVPLLRSSVSAGTGIGAPVASPRERRGRLAVVVAVLGAVLAIVSVDSVPTVVVAYGRFAASYPAPNALYVGEGMNSTIAVTQLDNGVRNFHVSGKVEASTETQDMRLQRMLGHISALLITEPRSVLVVGFGAGVTAGSFVLHPELEHMVICEIEPLIPQIVSTYFKDQNYDVLNDTRVHVSYDDARHFILTTNETFDVITSDPIHPWVKGAATLYTKEYFELAKKHLNPGGVITQWVPLYESNEDVVKSEIATFFDVFPNGTIWSNDFNGSGYDVVLVGQVEPTRINVDDLEQRLGRADHERVAASLREVGFNSILDLLATYAGRGPDLEAWLKDAEINRDSNLRLQYLAGMGLNQYQNAAILSDVLKHRRFPEDLFIGSPQLKQALRVMLTRDRK